MRSAAKVALGSFVAGCGGVMLVEGEGSDAAPVKDASSKDAARACIGPLEGDASVVSEETFQCCVADVQATVGDASPWDPNAPDAGIVASDPCCEAIIARMDHEPYGGNFGADYNEASRVVPWCCLALGHPEGPACTPWGPPTPPAMEVA